MSEPTNEAVYRFELPAELDNVELSERISTATLQMARTAGAVAVGDIRVIGSLDMGTGMRQHSVQVRLYFGGGARSDM